MESPTSRKGREKWGTQASVVSVPHKSTGSLDSRTQFASDLSSCAQDDSAGVGRLRGPEGPLCSALSENALMRLTLRRRARGLSTP